MTRSLGTLVLGLCLGVFGACGSANNNSGGGASPGGKPGSDKCTPSQTPLGCYTDPDTKATMVVECPKDVSPAVWQKQMACPSGSHCFFKSNSDVSCVADQAVTVQDTVGGGGKDATSGGSDTFGLDVSAPKDGGTTSGKDSASGGDTAKFDSGGADMGGGGNCVASNCASEMQACMGVEMCAMAVNCASACTHGDANCVQACTSDATDAVSKAMFTCADSANCW